MVRERREVVRAELEEGFAVWWGEPGGGGGAGEEGVEEVGGRCTKHFEAS